LPPIVLITMGLGFVALVLLFKKLLGPWRWPSKYYEVQLISGIGGCLVAAIGCFAAAIGNL
jgi:hypothetical protein